MQVSPVLGEDPSGGFALKMQEGMWVKAHNALGRGMGAHGCLIPWEKQGGGVKAEHTGWHCWVYVLVRLLRSDSSTRG